VRAGETTHIPANAPHQFQENLSARLGNRRCRTAQIRGNLKWQSEPSPERRQPGRCRD
jgi:hypothetical protein